MISIFTEAAHALFYTTGGACCGFFLAALCHAAGNDSDDRQRSQSGPPAWQQGRGALPARNGSTSSAPATV